MTLTSPLTFYRDAYAAITDFPFYRRIFEQPLNRSLFYLIFLCTHAAIVLTIVYSLLYLPAADNLVGWAADNFPDLAVADGRLQMDVAAPEEHHYYGDQVITFVFDNQGQYSNLHQLTEPAIVFTEEYLYLIWQSQIQTWPWSQFSPMQVTRQEWLGVRSLLPWFFIVFGLGFWFVVSLIWKLLQALMMVFIAATASARQGVQLPFANCLNISLYSLTPATALELLVAMSTQSVPFFVFIYLLTAAIYTYMATTRCVTIE